MTQIYSKKVIYHTDPVAFLILRKRRFKTDTNYKNNVFFVHRNFNLWLHLFTKQLKFNQIVRKCRCFSMLLLSPYNGHCGVHLRIAAVLQPSLNCVFRHPIQHSAQMRHTCPLIVVVTDAFTDQNFPSPPIKAPKFPFLSLTVLLPAAVRSAPLVNNLLYALCGTLPR